MMDYTKFIVEWGREKKRTNRNKCVCNRYVCTVIKIIKQIARKQSPLNYMRIDELEVLF